MEAGSYSYTNVYKRVHKNASLGSTFAKEKHSYKQTFVVNICIIFLDEENNAFQTMWSNSTLFIRNESGLAFPRCVCAVPVAQALAWQGVTAGAVSGPEPLEGGSHPAESREQKRC